ncbi:hypothetical protein FOCG_18316 [Fusarium oxysporum f. sp. radicis-lycopersici 26381]|nr:hypothetical protein FOCG_18316 [Fusarium oxysporum f. sp. radicis-lycopersici 26381]
MCTGLCGAQDSGLVGSKKDMQYWIGFKFRHLLSLKY